MSAVRPSPAAPADVAAVQRRTLWVLAVNNHGAFGRWAHLETTDPWDAQNVNNNYTASYAGWKTLVMQVSGGEVKYYIDGTLVATHGGIYYPEQVMSINFNLWFISGGLAAGTTYRDYREELDWVFYAKNTVLTPAQVTANVSNYKSLGTVRLNTMQ